MLLENIGQYLIIIAGVAAIILFKVLALRTKVSKQTDNYIHPQLCIDELKSKVGTPQKAQQLLALYLKGTQPTQDRIRNIAIMVAYINSVHLNPPLTKPIRTYLTTANKLEGFASKYIKYIQQSILQWK